MFYFIINYFRILEINILYSEAYLKKGSRIIKLIIHTNEINKYLSSTDIIDYDNPSIQKIANELIEQNDDELDLIKTSFKFVRDSIGHSADINGNVVTCKASDVLLHKEGICYAKSHLLAALLRANRIPAGFCYQRLILDDQTDPYLVLHGLNGVFISSLNKWIRLDARGNKENVNAQFSTNEEMLAFPIRLDKGEEDSMTIFSVPDDNIINVLEKYKNVVDLFNNLPRTLRKVKL